MLEGFVGLIQHILHNGGGHLNYLKQPVLVEVDVLGLEGELGHLTAAESHHLF